jgi:beta-lactam-binding protein with PASTA domain
VPQTAVENKRTVDLAATFVEVPNVTDLKVGEAAVILKRQGFGLIFKSQTELGVMAGRVLQQEPSARNRVSPGTNVIVTVATSSGRPQRPVPDVTKRTLTEAQEILTKAGFKVGVKKEVVEMAAPPGTIIGQSPEPDGTAESESPIALFVAALGIPDLRRVRLEDAYKILTKAGLKVGVVTIQQSRFAPFDAEVVDQKPAPMSVAKQSMKVNLTASISLHIKVIQVPDVTKRPLKEAVKILYEAGFNVGAVVRQDDRTVRWDSVIDQFPAAGSTVERGSKVYLTGECQASCRLNGLITLLV